MYQITSILLYTLLLYYINKRSSLITISLFGILFFFTWRVVSAVYIDGVDWIYAIELFRSIGGGYSALVLIAMYGAMAFGLLAAMSPTRLEVLKQLFALQLFRRPVFLGLGLDYPVRLGFVFYIIALYVEFVLIGVYPAVEGIERHVYRQQFAGVVGELFFRYASFVFFFLGMFYFSNRDKPNRPSIYYLIFAGLLLFYYFLAGHKFSSLFVNFWFFLMPVSLSFLGRRPKAEVPAEQGHHWSGARYGAFTRLEATIGICFFLLLVVYAVFNTLVNIRGLSLAEAFEYLEHRLFVQQGQMWWTTYERIILDGERNFGLALNYVFLDPIADGNTSLFYLMFMDLGVFVYDALWAGSHFTGGYPDILLELFGPVFAPVACAGAAYLMGRLLIVLFRLVLLGHYMGAIAFLFVVQPFIVFHLGGKAEFLVSWEYYVKIVLCLFVLLLEYRFTTVRDKTSHNLKYYNNAD